MTWDPRTNITGRKVQHFNWANSDQELVANILDVAEGYRKTNNTNFPLVIDAQPDVPWQDVVHVMDLCRRNRIEKIEFSAPEVPITPIPMPTTR